MTTQPTARRPDTDRVRIFDTTLRDGEQSPGASMTREEKIDAILQALVFDGGMWGSSRDFDNWVGDMLLNGVKGLKDMTDAELDADFSDILNQE